MKIIVGSASQRKMDVVKGVFLQYFNEQIEVVGHNAPSGVPDTPYDKQTYDGALNRAKNSRNVHPVAEYYVGLESGLVERFGSLYEEAWACIIDKQGKEYYGYSSGLRLPDYVIKKMKDMNLEHSVIMSEIQEKFGIVESDTWGTYSGGTIRREVSLEEALRNALIQILTRKNNLYSKE